MDSFTANYRSAAYWLLSQCYLPPDDRLLDALKESDIDGLCTTDCSPLEDLQRDYAQLFLGPFTVPAPPYGSVYLEINRQVCGETTSEMMARYREEGLKVTLQEPADHVAIELEYMYVLVLKEMDATAAGDDGNVIRYLDKQRDFLETHLGVWVPMLTQRIV